MRSVWLLLLLLVAAPAAHAQTGKIAGTVTDSRTGEPLPGVNLVIVGTTTGATTDLEGFYNILNVSPGRYALRASFIGYTPQVIENVDVNIDLTSTIDFALQEETLGLDEVVVTAAAPIIQADISGSQRNIDAAEIQAGRYQNVNNLITAQLGVNSVGVYEDQPQIRGSSMEESAFLVDGVNQGDPLTNRPYYRVNLDAVQEVKMQTGGFSAEFGDVRSGVINVVTREGGETYSGTINFQYSPPGLKHFGPMMFGFESPLVTPFVDPEAGAFSGVDKDGKKNPFFAGWEALAQDKGKAGPHLGEPMELYARWLWRHRSQDAIDELKRLQREGLVDLEWGAGVDPDEAAFHEYGIRPDYRASFTLGGPVPLVRRVKFFVSYDQEQTEYAYRASEPVYRDRHLRAKLTTNLTRSIKLNVHGLYANQKGGGPGEGPGLAGMIRSDPFSVVGSTNKLWYPHCATPAEQWRQIYGARLTHTLSSRTFYEVKFSHSRTDYELYEGRRNTTPVQGGLYEGQTNLNEGLIGTTEEAEQRAASGEYGWESWRDWAMIRIGDVWYDEAPKGHVPINWRDITGEYRYGSCKTRFNDTYSRSYNFAADVTSQLDRHNQIKAGIQVNYDHVFGRYEWVGASTNTGTIEEVNARPWTGAVYAQDKLEFKGLIANLGVRADWILHDVYPVLGGAEDDKLGGPYSDYLLSGRADSLWDHVPTKRVTDVRLSPRLGLSFPITTVAKIFLNYGHFYQWPEVDLAYRLMRDMSKGGRVDRIGNPRLEPPRTIAYEVGYEHNLFNRMNLTLTGYYKDINNETAGADFYPLGFGGASYEQPINMRFRDVRGLETLLELRQGVLPFFSGWTSVNYMVESGGAFGYDRFYEDPSRQPREVSSEVSNPDVRPIVKMNLDLHTPEAFGPSLGDRVSLLGGLRLNLLFTWQRGRQFTWNPDGIPYVEDNVRWRPYRRWDLRLTKDLFQAGSIASVFYIDVTNLFNQRNMTPDNVRWAWDGHRWWKNQFRTYMNSLDLEVQRDGSLKGKDRPGDWKGEHIDLPDFTPWTFLERRNVFFGVKLYF